ncbi:MAG TPA: hypothetical protein VIH10_10290 [Kribbella sp.]|jgi:hypothetical protein
MDRAVWISMGVLSLLGAGRVWLAYRAGELKAAKRLPVRRSRPL